MRKLNKKWVTAMCLMAVGVLPAMAQDKLETSVGADVVSKYVWRGVNQNQGAAFQPSLGFSYKGISLGAWGSVGFANPDAYEFDLSLGYSVGGLSVAITDYYWDGHATPYTYGDYTDAHRFEGVVAYNFGESFPLTLSWATFFAGADKKITATGEEQNYSTYISASYDFSCGGTDFTAAIGVSPWTETLWAQGEDFQICDISLKATKTLTITPTFSIPLFVQGIIAPATESAHLVVGFSF
ncbi:MAG: hypothetical protein LBT48_03535 [Prevotellaceae bacterium]|jgi:hypothetical protein|nr:hypothetical protein [Prevotellaceae bacterium]